MHGIGITSFAYIPLSVANPKHSSTLIAMAEKIIQDEKSLGKLPTGLAVQYDRQLATLKDDTVPDIELVGFPGLFTTTCMLSVSRVTCIQLRGKQTTATPQPGTKYTTMLMMLNHPFSRGSIVSYKFAC